MVAGLRSAAVGAAAWALVAMAAATGAVELTLIEVLLALAPLVVVPIGLMVTGQPQQQTAVLLRLAAATLVVPSLVVDNRATAGPRALLIVSTVAVTAPMVLAVFWAAGQHYDVPALDVPAMARIHGTLNAFGFSLAGLLGWLLRDSPTSQGAYGPSTPRSAADPGPPAGTR